MHREQFTEGERKGHLAVLVPFPLRNADLAAFNIDLGEPNGDQFADSHPGIEQGFDQDHIREVAAVPHRLVEAAQLLLRWDLWQALRCSWNSGLQLLPQRPKDAF